MISGTVNNDFEAMIPVLVHDVAGTPRLIEAVIDTGFNGYLSLPPDLISSLQLPWLCRQDAMLADGKIQPFDVHHAKVMWNGAIHDVEADAAEGAPLVGMRLMFQSRLMIDVIPRGDVVVGPLPENKPSK